MSLPNPKNSSDRHLSQEKSSSHTPPSGEQRHEQISVILPHYKLHIVAPPSSYRMGTESQSASTKGPHSTAASQEVLEIEENSTIGYTRFSRPKHDLKQCLQSLQSLSPKNRQTLRIVAIGIASVFALVAIFYIARIAEQSGSYDEVSLQRDFEGQYVKYIPLDKMENKLNLEYGLQNSGEHQGLGYPIKVFKDINGKAKQNDKTLNADNYPVTTAPHLEKPYFEVPRVEDKKSGSGLDTAAEISDTFEIIKRKVDLDRKKISNKEFRFWESGSEPLRLLLVSTWASGVTLLGKLLESHPGVYHHFEPLSFLGMKQVRSGKEAFQAQQVIHRLLDCSYEGMDSYINYTKDHPEATIGYNPVVWDACNSRQSNQACLNEAFLSEACKLFPIQLVETVRFRLNLTQLLLNDVKLRVKVIFLVRDPRGTMNSRYSNLKWCSSSPDCASPETLCNDLQGDLKVATAFEKLYPSRFLKIKYENLAEDTEKEIKRILTFLGLEFTEDMKNFVQVQIQSNLDSPWSLQRKASDRSSIWKKQLPLEEIHEIQNSCELALKNLNYEIL